MRVQLLRLLRAGTTIRPVTRSNYVASVSRCKPFSTSGAVQQHKIDPEALDRLGKAIQENQALQEKLQDAASYMVSSGLLNIGKKPSMFDMLKILSKKEAREKLQARKLLQRINWQFRTY